MSSYKYDPEVIITVHGDTGHLNSLVYSELSREDQLLQILRSQMALSKSSSRATSELFDVLSTCKQPRYSRQRTHAQIFAMRAHLVH